MTREETIEFGKMWLQINEDSPNSSTYKFFQMAIKALEQEPVIDPVIESAYKTGYEMGRSITMIESVR